MAVVNVNAGAENVINRLDQRQDQVLAVTFDIDFCQPRGDTNKIGGRGALFENDLPGLVTYLEPAAVDQRKL